MNFVRLCFTRQVQLASPMMTAQRMTDFGTVYMPRTMEDAAGNIHRLNEWMSLSRFAVDCTLEMYGTLLIGIVNDLKSKMKYPVTSLYFIYCRIV